MEKAKITPKMMVNILIITIIGTAILVAPGAVTKSAKQDSWLTFAVAALPSYITAVIIISLGVKFPGRTMISYIEDIMGKYPGKMLSLLYVLFLIRTGSIIFREFGEFLTITVFHRTPLPVFLVTVAFISGYAVYKGIGVLGRLAEIIVPVVVFSYILVVFLDISQVNVMRLLPFGEGGYLPVIKGALVPNAYLGEVFIIGFLLPHLDKPGEIKKTAALSIVIVTILLTVGTMAVITIFGVDITSRFRYPSYELFRSVNIGLLNRQDPLGMAIWVAGGFLKVAIFYYLAVVSTAEWLNLRDYHPLILPLGIIMVSFANIFFTDINQLSFETTKIFPILAPIFEIIIPSILLIISMLSQKK